MTNPASDNQLASKNANLKIAYFCAEYAIDTKLHSYAGGLGVLAGDLLLEAGDSSLDFNLISLFYSSATSNPSRAGLTLLPEKISCPLGQKEITLQIWTRDFKTARIFLLDTNAEGNSPEDRKICQSLYGPDDQTMLQQQIILGFGSIKLFDLLVMTPDIYHLNEGHTALTTLALACQYSDSHPASSLKSALEAIKPKVVATKHTILPIAGLHIPWELPRTYLGPILEKHNLKFDDLVPLAPHKSKPELFSTTQLLLSFSSKSTAVSIPHAKFEKEIHPDSPLIPITNGVNQKRWQTNNPKERNKEILKTHLEYLNIKFDPKTLLIIWARRLAAYKRPHLLFSDITRLEQIVNLPNRPVQIIIAGKANPTSPEATKLVQEITSFTQEPNIAGKVIFLPEYNLELASQLTAAADVWLNTPLPGKEASGTSGMKAALNGALQFSTADGWIAENDWTGIGWILFEDNIADNLYNIIEKEIVPLYYEDQKEWSRRTQKTREIVEQHYTTTRVLNDYLKKLYFPSS